MLNYPQLSTDSIQSLWKSETMAFFTEIEKNYPKVAQITIAIFSKKKHSWRHHTSWFQHLLQIYSNQSYILVCYWQRNRHTYQRNRIESLEINSGIHGQLIFDKGTENSFLNIVAKIVETQAKEWNRNPPIYHSEKLTQNGLRAKRY